VQFETAGALVRAKFLDEGELVAATRAVEQRDLLGGMAA